MVRFTHPRRGSLGSGTVNLVMHELRNDTGALSQADKRIN